MPEDSGGREVPIRKGSMGEDPFDKLAKGLAGGTITRGQALKLAGAAILGTTLTTLFPKWAFAQSGCPEDLEPCGDGCCDITQECCAGVVCCDAAEECCAGVCCEPGKVCVGGQCVCPSDTAVCGSSCCNAAVETCIAGQCRNLYCEWCSAQGGNCCQVVGNGVLIHEACCGAGTSICSRGGVGCICCGARTRCPRPNEAFTCVRR